MIITTLHINPDRILYRFLPAIFSLLFALSACSSKQDQLKKRRLLRNYAAGFTKPWWGSWTRVRSYKEEAIHPREVIENLLPFAMLTHPFKPGCLKCRMAYSRILT